MGSLQREIAANPGIGGSSCLQGMDLPQSEETVAGEGGGGQEPQNEGLPGLHEVRHTSHAQPSQCAHSTHGAVLRPTVGAAGRLSATACSPPGACTDASQRSVLYGEGNGNPLQYSCLEKSMDRGVWQAEVHDYMTEHVCTRVEGGGLVAINW